MEAKAMLEAAPGLRAKLRLICSICGFMLGLPCIVAGIAIGLLGVIGDTSVTAQVLGLSANLNDAAPGAILLLSGAFVIWTTRRETRPALDGGSPGRSD